MSRPSLCLAAHCLHTVTEDNPELLCSLNAAVLGVVEGVLLTSQPDMAHTLLRTLAAGAVCLFTSISVFKSKSVAQKCPSIAAHQFEGACNSGHAVSLRDSVEREGQLTCGPSGPDAQRRGGHLVQVPGSGRRNADT